MKIKTPEIIRVDLKQITSTLSPEVIIQEEDQETVDRPVQLKGCITKKSTGVRFKKNTKSRLVKQDSGKYSDDENETAYHTDAITVTTKLRCKLGNAAFFVFKSTFYMIALSYLNKFMWVGISYLGELWNEEGSENG